MNSPCVKYGGHRVLHRVGIMYPLKRIFIKYVIKKKHCETVAAGTRFK